MRAVILQPRTVPNSRSSPRKVPKTAKIPKTTKTDTLLIHKFEFCGNVRNRIPKISESAKKSYLCGQFKKKQRCKVHRVPGKLLGVLRLFTFSGHEILFTFSCDFFCGICQLRDIILKGRDLGNQVELSGQPVHR